MLGNIGLTAGSQITQQRRELSLPLSPQCQLTCPSGCARKLQLSASRDIFNVSLQLDSGLGCNYAVLGQACQDCTGLTVQSYTALYTGTGRDREQHSPTLNMCPSLNITTCPSGLLTLHLHIYFPNDHYVRHLIIPSGD